MKKHFSMILCLVAMAMFGLSSCEKDNNGDNNNNTNQTTHDMVVGTWLVDNVKVDGNDMTPQNLKIIMNADGTGTLDENGVTENNEFTWSVEGNTLTIVHKHGSPKYDISYLTENECTLTGNTIPGFDSEIGAVVMHLTRVK